jgi:hypothetical protein
MASSALDKAKAAAASAIEKNKDRREVRKSKGRGDALWVVWADSMQEHFPGVPLVEWKDRQRALVKRIIIPTLRDHDPRKFIEVIIEKWDSVLRHKFKTLASKPQAPSIDFVIRFIEQFVEFYAEETGGLARHKPVANVRTKAEEERLAALEKTNASLRAERDEAVQQAERLRQARIAELGKGTGKAVKLRRLEPREPAKPRTTTDNDLPDWK